MGFILENTNTFEVSLTELGKEKFFDGGLKDAIAYFSLVDSDANYDIFDPIKTEVLQWTSGTTYNVGDVVEYSNDYYRKVAVDNANPTQEYIPTNLTYWDKITVFDATNIGKQTIPTIYHTNGFKTSLINANDSNGVYTTNVYTQTKMRGDRVDNTTYKRALFRVKSDTQKSYVFYEPALTSEDSLKVLTYIKNG